jgi:hypothetical protein
LGSWGIKKGGIMKKIIFFLLFFKILFSQELPFALGINNEVAIQNKINSFFVSLPIKKKLRDLKVEVKMLAPWNNTICGLIVGDYKGELKDIKFEKIKGLYFCWEERGHHYYVLNILEDKKILAISEGKYPINFHKYVLKLEGEELSAWVDEKQIFEGKYLNRPDDLEIFLYFEIVGNSPVLVDDIFVYEISSGKEKLIYENHFEDEEDIEFLKVNREIPSILKICEIPIQYIEFKGIEDISYVWYGFGIPGYGIDWVDENTIISAPGEGDIQITDVSDVLTPKVIGQLGAGFLGGFGKICKNKYIIGPRGEDFVLNFENKEKPLKEKIIYPQEISKLKGPIDFRAFNIIEKSGRKYLIASNPYSETSLVIFDITENILTPKLVNYLEIAPKVDNWGGINLGEDFLLLACGRKDKGWGIAVIDISDITSPKFINWFPQDNTNLLFSFDETHIFVKTTIEKNLYLQIWELEEKNKSWKMISKYQIKEYPCVNGAIYDGKNSEIILSLAYEAGAQDTVWEKSEGGKREGSSCILGVKVNKKWEMEEIYKIPSWGRSRFKSLSLSPDGKYLAISDYNYGVWVLRRDREKNWVKISGFMTPAEGHWCCLDSNRPYVYVFPTFGSQMRIYDISDIKNPKEISQFWLEEWTLQQPYSIANFVIVPHQNGISVVDVSDPKNPKLFERWEFRGRILTVPDKGFIFISYTKSPSWGKWQAYIKIKKLVKDKFIDIGEIIIRDENVNGSDWPPNIEVEGNRLYVNDLSADIFSVWEFNENGEMKKIGEISTKDWGLGKQFNMDYPGRFAVKEKRVYLPMIGEGKKADLPLFYVIDTSTKPFLKVYEQKFPYGSSIMDIKIYKNYLLLSDYYWVCYVYEIKGNKIIPKGKFWKEMGWTFGNINSEGILIYPGLWNLRIVKIR